MKDDLGKCASCSVKKLHLAARFGIPVNRHDETVLPFDQGMLGKVNAQGNDIVYFHGASVQVNCHTAGFFYNLPRPARQGMLKSFLFFLIEAERKSMFPRLLWKAFS